MHSKLDRLRMECWKYKKDGCRDGAKTHLENLNWVMMQNEDAWRVNLAWTFFIQHLPCASNLSRE